MRDCFALLGEPRRPWGSPEDLQQKFITLSARAHPDRVHGAGPEERRQAQDAYAELNSAFQVLKEPRARLRHLLELETGSAPAQVEQIPAEWLDLFVEAGQVLRQAGFAAADYGRAASPLLRASMFPKAQAQAENLRGLQQKLKAWHEQLVQQLQALDNDWSARSAESRPTLLQTAERLYRAFSYCSRWSAQAQDQIAILAS